jgi:hypothetical protein
MSIKANELRLGNWIYNNNFEYQVTPYVIEELWASVRGWVQPIPITDKWLFKFGFEETDPKKFIGGLYTRKKSDGFYGFYINKETMSYCTFDYEGTIENIIKIEYVHQLQNIYFALTNEELEIKR